jgi:hypothetical protein
VAPTVVAPTARLYWPAHDLLPHREPGDHPMNAEFNWWLLIVGLVLGAALTWLVMADLTRRDADVDAAEEAGEARWIAAILTDSGRPIAADRVEEVLRLHRDYLAAPPPDDPVLPEDDAHDWPTRTGAPSTESPATGTSEIPKVEPGPTPVREDARPTQ